MGLDSNGSFAAIGFKREHWKDAGAIRKAFKQAFSEAGLPYFKPHSIRATVTQLGQRICKTPEEFKAWSKNMGHDDVLVTFSSYGDVSSQRQAEIILGLGAGKSQSQDQSAVDEMAALVARLQAQGKAA